MSRYEYAWLRFGGSGPTAVFFSHTQSPQLINELAPVLGQSLLVPQSSEWTLAFNGATINMPYLSGLLGDRGWELVNADTLVVPQLGSLQSLNPQTTLYFKRTVDG